LPAQLPPELPFHIRPFREIFDQPGQALLREKNVELRLQTNVQSWQRVNNKIRLYGSDYDAVLLALPWHALAALLPGKIVSDNYTPIVSYYLRSSHQLTDKRMVFLVDSPLQWLFRVPHEVNFYTLTLSDSQLNWPPGTNRTGIAAVLAGFLANYCFATSAYAPRDTLTGYSLHGGEKAGEPRVWGEYFLPVTGAILELPATFEAAAAQGAEAAKTINQQFV
jgi:hypothetical protein